MTMKQGYYTDGSVTYAVAIGGKQAIRLTDGELFEPPPGGLTPTEYNGPRHIQLAPGYSIRLEPENMDHDEGWATVGDED